MQSVPSLTSALERHIAREIGAHGGWIGFDRFMAMALYAPGLGYYANEAPKFGTMPPRVRAGVTLPGSDFVTAPELSRHFGQALAAQVAQALQASASDEVWEFGAGSGALALQLLETLGQRVRRYHIVELSASLAQRQRLVLQGHAHKLQWELELPPSITGVVIGNELLDAMPVRLLQRRQGQWHERGVALGSASAGPAVDAPLPAPDPVFVWQDRLTPARPPLEIAGTHDYLTEIHPQAEAFIRTLAERLRASEQGGAVFLIDYGFPEREYYHPQRHMGTLMCHHAHQADTDPLSGVGAKDLSAHVDFTGIAVAAQDAGLELLGYASQGRFLLNCGLLDTLENASLADSVMAQKLVMEHEMGELFKVIGLCTGAPWPALGFALGDRLHTL